MSVSRDEVMRIAGLARLRLESPPGAQTDAQTGAEIGAQTGAETGAEGRFEGIPEAVARLTHDLNRILEYVETLQEADISDVADPIRLPQEAVPFRDPTLAPDRLPPGAPGDRAPGWRDGFFVVPRLPAMETGETIGTGEEGGDPGRARDGRGGTP